VSEANRAIARERLRPKAVRDEADTVVAAASVAAEPPPPEPALESTADADADAEPAPTPSPTVGGLPITTTRAPRRTTPDAPETVRWRAETATSTIAGDAPEPKSTNGILAHGNGNGNGATHESAPDGTAHAVTSPGSDLPAAKSRRRWRLFGRAR